MSKNINIELIQDKYTNFILYDGSDRCDYTEEWVEPVDVTGITMVLTDESDALELSRTIIVDSTQNAKAQCMLDFNGFDFSCYLCHKDIMVSIAGEDAYTVTVTENMDTATELASFLDTEIDGVTVTAVNDRLLFVSDLTPSGESGLDSPQINVLGGSLLELIGLQVGVYNGNTIEWGDSNITQEDLRFTISPIDLGFIEEMPIGKWVVETIVTHSGGTHIDTYTEFSYKQLELYRAKFLEDIAKKFNDFDLIEQRMQTKMELDMKAFMTFDVVYKAMISAINVGNSLQVSKNLLYLHNHIKLNPIESGE